ncbi:MAG TPA: type IX secretion system membrane protein PorP/SprF [Bacteroidetes bacterium]|nr:type IX secretion system membrane protein PorP/SprF [Bacteroidota bacterium]
MTLREKILIYMAFMLLSAASAAQQLPLYSQYIFNEYLINPAVAGSDGYTSINLTAREQWLGYSGAPRTYSFSFQTRLLKSGYTIKKSSARKKIFRPGRDGKVGLGAYVFSDRNGLIQRTGFQTTYAYHTWIYGGTQLSFGLSATAFHFRIDEDRIRLEDPDDPILYSNLREGVFIPDANFGVYLLNYRYNAGFSIEQLFQSYIKLGNPSYKNLSLLRHYYLFGAYSFPLDTRSEIEPNFMFRMSEQLKPQVDIGMRYTFLDDFWGGLSYRTGNIIITSIGARWNDLYFGYAFDYSFSEIQSYTYGSHEIIIALKLGSSARRYRWLDRY